MRERARTQSKVWYNAIQYHFPIIYLTSTIKKHLRLCSANHEFWRALRFALHLCHYDRGACYKTLQLPVLYCRALKGLKLPSQLSRAGSEGAGQAKKFIPRKIQVFLQLFGFPKAL